MDVKKLLLYFGLPILGLGIIVGVVLVLRQRNLPIDTQAPLVLPGTQGTQTGGLPAQNTGQAGRTLDRKDLTAAEKAEMQQNQNAIANPPVNAQDNWTPEFRKKMEETTKTP